MNKQLISYARSSAEWLRGMEAHIKYGSQDWIVGRSILAASELENCIAAISDLESRLEKALAKKAYWKTEAQGETAKVVYRDKLIADLTARLEKAEAERDVRFGGFLNESEFAEQMRALKSPHPTPDQG